MTDYIYQKQNENVSLDSITSEQSYIKDRMDNKFFFEVKVKLKNKIWEKTKNICAAIKEIKLRKQSYMDLVYNVITACVFS